MNSLTVTGLPKEEVISLESFKISVPEYIGMRHTGMFISDF